MTSVCIHDFFETLHDAMNPFPVDKVRLIGERMRLKRGAARA